MLSLGILTLVFWTLFLYARLSLPEWLEKTLLALTVVSLLVLIGSEVHTSQAAPDYEHVTVLVTTEFGVVEVNDEDYYKDGVGNYFIKVEDKTKRLWLPFYKPAFEKVEAPVFEFDSLNPHPITPG